MNLKKIYEKIKQDQVLAGTTATLLSTTILGIWGAITGKINKQTIVYVVEFIKSILAYKVSIVWIVVSNLIIFIIVTMYFSNKKKNLLESKIVDNNITINGKKDIKENSYIQCPNCSMSLKVEQNLKTNTGIAKCSCCNIQIEVEVVNDQNTIKKIMDIKNANYQENNCEGFKDFLINEFSLFTYEEVTFKLSYKIENNKVLINKIEPICSSCNCNLYTSYGYLGQPDDGIDILKLICPECKCDEFEFSYTEYNELIDRCNYVLNNKLKYKEKEYEEYKKNLEVHLDFNN